ncbi:MAG: DUF89 domain-containing protein [Planctomycetota bacterium]
MKIEPACIPCALRRALATAERISADPWLHHKLLVKAMGELEGMERDLTPAQLNAQLWAVVSKTLGATDPYQGERTQWRRELGDTQRFATLIKDAEDPLLAALVLSGRVNVFDDECLNEGGIREELRRMRSQPGAEPTDSSAAGGDADRLACSDLDLFLADLEQAKTLLFVHDSGPEVPIDALLIREILGRRPDLQVTCVVRTRPILLDATREDLEESGLLTLPGVRGIDPGIDTLGVPLSECSRELREEFERADLVLGKGQAAFETLAQGAKATYFLMRIKCPVMAKVQGLRVGELAFIKGS